MVRAQEDLDLREQNLLCLFSNVHRDVNSLRSPRQSSRSRSFHQSPQRRRLGARKRRKREGSTKRARKGSYRCRPGVPRVYPNWSVGALRVQDREAQADLWRTRRFHLETQVAAEANEEAAHEGEPLSRSLRATN